MAGQPRSPPKATPRKPTNPAPPPPKTGQARNGAPPLPAPPPAVNQQQLYKPGTPPRFFDEEITRMHKELEKRAPADRSAARKALRPVVRRRKGITVTGFLIRVALFYLAIAYFLVCPNETGSGDRAVCRGLDSVTARIESLKPVARPYLNTASRKIQPYVDQVQQRAQPYVDIVRPHYHRADHLTRPHFRTVDKSFRSHVYPRLVAAVHRSQAFTKPYVDLAKKQYTKTLAPSVEWYAEAFKAWWGAKVEPHLSFATQTGSKYLSTVSETVSPVYTHGVPLVKHHYRTHLRPFSRRAYSTSHRTYNQHIHPRAVTVAKHSVALYRTKVSPALQRFWSRFVEPQVEKIRERIFEYKSKKAKQEAVERVEKQSEDEFEDFLQELRDHKSTTSDAEDVVDSPALSEDVPPAYSAPPPPAAAAVDATELAAQIAEKRAALENLQSAYEREIAHHGQMEQALLVERLLQIRQHALSDIPARFNASLEKLDEEGDKMIGRMGKFFARVAADSKLTVEEKVEDAEFLSTKAKEKVEKMAEKIRKEVEEYRTMQVEKEDRAVEEAKKAVTDLVNKAQSELGVGWTWLENVTAKDWARYHALRQAEQNLHKSFSGLANGDIKHAALDELHPYEVLESYHEQPDRLVSAFEKILNKIKIKGQRELKGEWQGVAPEAQKLFDSVSGKFGAVVQDLKESASSVVGVTQQPSGVSASISSLASVAQASANSVAQDALNALPTIEAHHEYVEAVKAAYGDSSQKVLRAVGVEPAPTDFRQSASSVASSIGSVASASAASAYGEASQSAIRAVGGEPSPTDLAQTLSSIGNVASASAASAYSSVISDYPSSISSALAAATQAVDTAAEEALSRAGDLAASAASVASSLAAPMATLINAAPIADAIEGAKEQVNEFFGEVSQTALSAVGVEPSPTNLPESATSIAHKASESLESVASKVSSLAAPHSSHAKSTASSLSRRAKPSAASASRSASSAAAAAAVPTNTDDLKASVSSVFAAASQKLHDATRTTAEGARETVSSLSSVASASVVSAASRASALAEPHPAYQASQGRASVQSAATGVKASVESVVSEATANVKKAVKHAEL